MKLNPKVTSLLNGILIGSNLYIEIADISLIGIFVMMVSMVFVFRPLSAKSLRWLNLSVLFWRF